MNSGQTMLRRERDNSGAMHNSERIAKNNHCIGALGRGGGKGGIELLGRSRLDYRESHAKVSGGARETHQAWCDWLLSNPSFFTVIDSYPIELLFHGKEGWIG